MKFTLPEVLMIVTAAVVATLVKRLDVTLVLAAAVWIGTGALRRHYQRRHRQFGP
jgi:hypothetical protein